MPSSTALGLGIASLLAMASTIALQRIRRHPAWLIAAALGADILLLTLLFWHSGGPTNPFTIVYISQVALSAMVLPKRWITLVALLAVCSFGLLFISPGWSHTQHGHGMHDYRFHLYGMLVAFAVTAVVITVVIHQLSHALTQSNAKIARHQRLSAMTTLAASAAHELSTPLNSIVLSAKDLLNDATNNSALKTLQPSLELIHQQTLRCRDLLAGMRRSAGDLIGESKRPLGLQELLDTLKQELPHDYAQRLNFQINDLSAQIDVPPQAFRHALLNVIINAFEASEPEQEVLFSVCDSLGTPSIATLDFCICDQGTGIQPNLHAHVEEPFVSTKGEGRGLGLFITSALASQLGATLNIDSTPGQGSKITLGGIVKIKSGGAEQPPKA